MDGWLQSAESVIQNCDWLFAQREIVEKQGCTLKEMNSKVEELEEQMKKDKEEAELALQQQKELYESKLQEAMDNSMNISSLSSSPPLEQIDMVSYTKEQLELANKVISKWQSYKYNSIKEALLRHAVLLKEANVISHELNKNVVFQYAVLSESRYFDLPSDIGSDSIGTKTSSSCLRTSTPNLSGILSVPGSLASGLSSPKRSLSLANLSSPLKGSRAGSPGPLRKIGSGVFSPNGPSPAPRQRFAPDHKKQYLVIEVTNNLTGAVFYWDLDKFKKRLEEMRELLASCPITPVPAIRDPFHERLPWFSLVGKAGVTLANLLHGIPMVHTVAVLDHKACIQGHLKIAVQIMPEEKRNTSNPSPIEFREPGQEETISSALSISTLASSVFSAGDLRQVGRESGSTTSSEDSQDANKCEDNGSEDTILKIGTKFTFIITVVQLSGLSVNYAEAFVQFKFLNKDGDAFSTEPHKNMSGNSLGFYHVQAIGVMVNKPFIEYIKSTPIMFEVFGHIQKHTLAHSEGSSEGAVTPVPKPVRQAAYQASPNTEVAQCFSLLVYVEICELSPTGEYVPVPVVHRNTFPTGSMHLLQQGIQRRIVFKVVFEDKSDFKWSGLREMVVGHVRQELDWNDADDLECDGDVLGLTLFEPSIERNQGEMRCTFVCEGNWDTSLHNSKLLNRPTPNGEHVFISISLYLELELCLQPLCINKDICLNIQGRNDSTIMRSMRKLFSGSVGRSPDCYKSFAIHEMMLCRTITAENSQPLVLQDTSATYVRGEEQLGSWKAHGEELITQHQQTLELLDYMSSVEETRQTLALKNKMVEAANSDTNSGGRRRRRERVNKKRENMIVVSEGNDKIEEVEYNERQQQLLTRCCQLLKRPCLLSTSTSSSPAPVLFNRAQSWDSLCEDLDEMYCPEMWEFSLGTEVSRKGFLHFMNMKTRTWIRKYCVVQRPFLLAYNSDKDPVPRWILNLSSTKISLINSNENVKLGVFRLTRGVNTYYFQGSSPEDIDLWLYAMNPLLAGTLRSQRQNSTIST